MRVLQICHRIPYPPSDGGSIAMHQITDILLNKGVKPKVLAVNPLQLKHPQELLSPDYVNATSFESVVIDTRIRPLKAFANLFSGKSYNIQRFENKKFSQLLKKTLKADDYNIIQLEGLYLTPYIPLIRAHSRAPVLFRAHNIEHFIWRRLAASESGHLKRWYLKLLAKRLEAYEVKAIHQTDGLIAITAPDKEYFLSLGYRKPSVVIPVGIGHTEHDQTLDKPIPNSVFHLGSMDWRPNQEGIHWFLNHVWPRVLELRPELTFFLAGRRMPAEFLHYAGPAVVVCGEVESASRFMAERELMVVPLLSGGGMRVKIIEGMSAGKPIVSTSIGAEGTGAIHGRHLLLADTPEAMAQSIVSCFDDREKMHAIGESGKAFVNEEFSMEKISNKLMDFYQKFL